MDINVGVLIGQLLVFGLGVAVLAWDRQRDRHKPSVDQSTAVHTDIDSDRLRRTVEEMSLKSNAWRDTWLWQLQGYLNLDSGWHLQVVANERLMLSLIRELIAKVGELGGDVSGITLPSETPPPPVIPVPPPVS